MSSVDTSLKIGIVLCLFLWNIFVSSRLETPYPESLIEVYALPFTRVLLLALVILSAIWSPTVGIMAALAFVCLGADVIFLTRRG
jgi:hypothetical protein